MRLLSIVSVLFVSSISYANYFVLPAGHHEAFMANAGGALDGSPGNVLYNPAGLAFHGVDQLSLSVSGTSLTKHEMRNEESNLSPNDYSIRPLMAAGIYPTELGTVAVFVANPIMFNFSGTLNSQSDSYDISTRTKMDSQILKAGVAFGAPVSQNFSWGVATGLHLSTLKSDSYSKVYNSGNLAMTNFGEAERMEKSLFVLAGVLFKPTQNWAIGLSAQFFPLVFDSSVVERVSIHSSAMPNEISEESVSYDGYSESSHSIRVSNRLNLLGGNELFIDWIYLSESSQKDSEGVVDTEPSVFQYLVGWRNSSFEKWQPLAGYSYSDSDNSKGNLVSAGVAFVRGRSELILGGYYLLMEPKGASTQDMAYSSYGFMFSSNVAY